MTVMRWEVRVFLDGRHCMTIPKLTRWSAEHEASKARQASGVGATSLFGGWLVPMFSNNGRVTAEVCRRETLA